MTKKYKVVITDCTFDNVAIERKVLAEVGAEVVVGHCKSEGDLLAVCTDADGLINQYLPITRNVLAALPKCRVIARYGMGVNNIDVAAATENGICVANIPDYCIDEVADHALALLLACARKVPFMNRMVKQGTWDPMAIRPVYGLRGQYLGLVGFGATARALAARTRALGLQLLVHDPWVPPAVVAEYGAEGVSLEELLSRADLVSLHVPLTEATHNMIGARELRLMKPSAFLINTSRGPVIDEEALAKALQSGWLAGAGLDVMVSEPPAPDNPLLAMPNVVITPHVAYYSEHSQAEMQRRAALQVALVLQGKYPTSLVNPSVQPKVALVRGGVAAS